jgi:nucleotide-binding universal stress UspA family protein
MRSPIVAGADGSPSADRAVEWAAAEAALRGRPLHIVCAVQPAYCPEAADLLADVGERVLAAAAGLAAKAVPDLTATTELMFGPPAHALRERSEDAWEIVVGHRGLGGFTGLLLGSTGLKVAGHTACPAVVVRGGAGTDRDEVVAGLDLREEDGVLAYAFETAAARCAWLRVVHAWDILDDGASPGTVRQALTVAQERLAAAVEPWRSRCPDVRVVEETPPGHPVEELVERSVRAALLVVGSHRHGIGPQISSVAHGVIHHADCPVAVLPPAP